MHCSREINSGGHQLSIAITYSPEMLLTDSDHE
jgi:hypothetical protein